MPKASFYAVNRGREPGVYSTWRECEAQVRGFTGARFKKFSDAAEAKVFAETTAPSSSQKQLQTSAKAIPSAVARATRMSLYRRPLPKLALVSPTVTRATPSNQQPRPQTPVQVTPSAVVTVRRTSPCRDPEPVPKLAPVSPTVTRATPSEQQPKAASPSATRLLPSEVAEEWNQGALSPDIVDESTWDVVYTDGACRRNGRPGLVAGIGVWWGTNDPRNLAERCPGAQTVNRAELIASDNDRKTAPLSERPLLIKTDSQYSVNCFKWWLPKWLENGFITTAGSPVKNAPLIRYLSALLDDRAQNGHEVRLQYIPGHAGHEGNEGADTLADQGADMPEVKERDWEKLEKALRAEYEPRGFPSGFWTACLMLVYGFILVINQYD